MKFFDEFFFLIYMHFTMLTQGYSWQAKPKFTFNQQILKIFVTE